MNFHEYRQEADQLYHEYMELLRESGGKLPPRLNAIWRPHFERFELIIDLTATAESISLEIEDFRKAILGKREELLSALENSFPSKIVISDLPTRSDDKKKNPETIIKSAKLALAAYKLRNYSRISIACEVFDFKDTKSEKNTKAAERNVRRYLAHAENLIKAAGAGQFPTALQAPIPQK